MGAPPPAPRSMVNNYKSYLCEKNLQKPLLACQFNILWISLITVIYMDPHSPNELIATRSPLQQNIVFSILGDPGAARRDDRMFVVKV